MRKSTRKPFQKSNTVATEKSLGLEKGCESQSEDETVGGGEQDRIKDRSPERCKSIGVNLKSSLPHPRK